MAQQEDTAPIFGELLRQSQSALAGLQALEDQLSARLADQHAQLKQVRAELEESRSAEAALQATNDRLAAELARAQDEVAQHRKARTDLEGTVSDVRRDLDRAVREHQETLALVARERGELQDRLARLEASLTQRSGQVAELEKELDQQRAGRAAWEAEKAELLRAREGLAGQIRELEAAAKRAAEDLEHAVRNREQLRGVYEDLKRTNAATVDRSTAAFKEMARLQDELQQAEARRSELEGRLASTNLSLEALTSAAESQDALLRQEVAALQVQFGEERERLQAALSSAQEQARHASEASASAEKARQEAQAQNVALLQRADAAAQEWALRRQNLAEENQRLSEEVAKAHHSQRSAEEASRTLQAQLRELEERHRRETASLRDEVRAAADAASRPLTPEQTHRINTRLNAIVGFATILLDPKANALTQAEHAEYIELVNENSRALAQEINLISPPATAPAAAPTTPARPRVASLGDPTAGPMVLVADTDVAVRERLVPFLTRAGYEVSFAATREEALKQAATLGPMLIMVDTAFQPGGASALIADLKRDPRTAGIPVVVTTPNLGDPLGIDLGQVDVLSKPIDRHQLLQVMINHDLQSDAVRARKLPATVLVIDDDPLSRRLLTAVLKPLHIDVITAEGGTAGINLARERKPELIICDLMMPEVDGFDVIAALRADDQTSKIPILVYSGKSITAEDQKRLQGLIPSIIRKGEFSRERFLEFLLKRGERRGRGDPPLAA